jgi:phage terminase small subunit
MTRSSKHKTPISPSISETPPVDELTEKQRLFISAYMTNGFNATQAAITAQYSKDSARAIGHENLTKPNIANEIQRLMREFSMPVEEVLARLTDHARGDVGDFLNDETGAIDWSKASGKTALIKRIKRKTETTRDKDGIETITLDEELELHSPQFALQLLGKQHRLFSDKIEHTGEDGGPIKLRLVRETGFDPKPHIDEGNE